MNIRAKKNGVWTNHYIIGAFVANYHAFRDNGALLFEGKQLF